MLKFAALGELRDEANETSPVVWHGVGHVRQRLRGRSTGPRPDEGGASVSTARSWTGCYIGAHVGAGWSRSDFSDPGTNGFLATIAPAGSAVRDNGKGVVGGGQIGCDYQFASNWVVGAAGDFSWASIDGVASDPFFADKTAGVPLTVRSHTNFLASATGRLGYTWDNVLLYGKGGVAWARDKYEVNNVGCLIFVSCNTGASATRTGWTAGGGIEWAFAPNWSVLLEYGHYGFGTKTLTFTDSNVPAGAPLTYSVKQDIDVVKAGLNWRFGNLLR